MVVVVAFTQEEDMEPWMARYYIEKWVGRRFRVTGEVVYDEYLRETHYLKNTHLEWLLLHMALGECEYHDIRWRVSDYEGQVQATLTFTTGDLVYSCSIKDYSIAGTMARAVTKLLPALFHRREGVRDILKTRTKGA